MAVEQQTTRAAELVALFETHMGIKSRTLAKAVSLAGRQLPRAMRTQAALLVEAEALAGNPKLMRQLDGAALEIAYRALSEHLAAIDLKERRRTRQLKVVAGIVFNLLLVFGALLGWIWWQGQP